MILSRRSDYGLRAALELAHVYGGGSLSAQRIARRNRLPIAFVKKLLQTLGRAGLVKATVGQQGGYTLTRPPKQISIRELLEALEGNLAPVSCLTLGDTCEIAASCPTQRVWRHIDGRIYQALESISLENALSLVKKKRS